MEIPYSVTVRPDTGMNNASLGLWLFLASEVMLFGGLISAYAFLRAGAAASGFGPQLSDVPMAGLNTLVLLASSVFITLSRWALRDRELGRHKVFLGVTIILGAIFIGIKAFDYAIRFSNGLYPSSSTYLAVFFTLTGVHALHVIGGMIVNGSLWCTGHQMWQHEPGRYLSRVSAASIYWNFVDAVWVVLFLLLYII